MDLLILSSIELVQRDVSVFLTFLNHINGFVLATWGFQATDMFVIVYCLSPFRSLFLYLLCSIDRMNL